MKNTLVFYFLVLISCCGLMKSSFAQQLSDKIPWSSSYKKYQSAPLKIRSNTYLFTVKFKNDFSGDYTGEIKYSKQNESYYLSCPEGDIYPSQTKFIYRIVDKDTILGNSWNNCWLFKYDSGAISTYAVLAGNADIYVKYISKIGNPKLYIFDEEFIDTGLVNLIKDDVEAVKYFKQSKRKYLFRKFGSLSLVGTALIIGGISKDESPVQIASWLSIPILITIPFLVYPPTPLEIIRYYNSNRIIEKEFGDKTKD